jgi:RecA-family ATPase
MVPDKTRALSALHHLDPGCGRDDWHRIGRAGIAAGLDIADIDEWSSSAANYRGSADVHAAFRTIKPEGGTGPGTLFRLAKAACWNEPATGIRPSLRKTRAMSAKPPASARPEMSATEVWARCAPATAAHNYIVAKDGRPDGLRVVPAGDPLRIAGQAMAGALVVPVVPLAGGEPMSLQFVATPEQAATWRAAGRPSKLNLPGAPVAGVFIVGDVEPAGIAYVCEGIGQAWACWKATGRAAVVCFGWGRVRAVAAELRRRDASARLVLVPDVGREAEAEAIACEVGAAVAAMPPGKPANYDAADLAAEQGADVLAELLGNASEPPKPNAPVHPLARFLDLDAEPVAPRVIVPGFIGHGLVIIAGGHGVGKTTALLPLAMVTAGLHRPGDPLAPKHWRHVVYVTEDTEQARRIVAGLVKFGGLGLDAGTVCERLHIVEACRLEPSYVAQVASTYREQFTRTCKGVEVLPLVVFDTKSAVLELEDENSNSEASAAVAMLKQSFEGLPVWLVGHIAKASMGRADVAGLSLRGGSAFEADATQVLYLVKDGEARFLVRGKTRFEADWPELAIESHTAATVARDEFGDPRPVVLRWAIARPPEQSREEAQEQAKEAARKAEAAALRDEVRGAVEQAWQGGYPLNREGVKAKVKRNRAEVTDTIENLLAERWLHEVSIPAKERTNPKRASFLVNLTTEEHEAARRGEGWPLAKLVVPESWRKAAVESVPSVVHKRNDEAAHATTV